MADAAGKATRNTRTVLLVCPSDTTTVALATILSQNSEAALTAQTARDAWDCVKSGVVGCVVLDLTAPTLEALTFFRAVRSSLSTNGTPFLFLIKKDVKIPALDRLSQESARDSWLALPCSGQLFLTAVRALLEQKSVRETQTLPLPAAAPGPEADPTIPATPPPQPAVTDNHPQALFSGQLGALDVTKILSMIEPLHLTGHLRLIDGKRQGAVYFVAGAVHHAELNDIEGPDALFLLFHLKSGSFQFDLDAATNKRTIEGNTMQLLLEGLRQMDEAKALVKAFQEKRSTQSVQEA